MMYRWPHLKSERRQGPSQPGPDRTHLIHMPHLTHVYLAVCLCSCLPDSSVRYLRSSQQALFPTGVGRKRVSIIMVLTRVRRPKAKARKGPAPPPPPSAALCLPHWVVFHPKGGFLGEIYGPHWLPVAMSPQDGLALNTPRRVWMILQVFLVEMCGRLSEMPGAPGYHGTAQLETPKSGALASVCVC